MPSPQGQQGRPTFEVAHYAERHYTSVVTESSLPTSSGYVAPIQASKYDAPSRAEDTTPETRGARYGRPSPPLINPDAASMSPRSLSRWVSSIPVSFPGHAASLATTADTILGRRISGQHFFSGGNRKEVADHVSIVIDDIGATNPAITRTIADAAAAFAHPDNNIQSRQSIIGQLDRRAPSEHTRRRSRSRDRWSCSSSRSRSYMAPNGEWLRPPPSPPLTRHRRHDSPSPRRPGRSPHGGAYARSAGSSAQSSPRTSRTLHLRPYSPMRRARSRERRDQTSEEGRVAARFRASSGAEVRRALPDTWRNRHRNGT